MGRFFSVAHWTRNKFIKFWYAMPVSSARALKYEIAPVSMFMVMGFLFFAYQGRNSFSSSAVIAGQSSVGVALACFMICFSCSVSGGSFLRSSTFIFILYV